MTSQSYDYASSNASVQSYLIATKLNSQHGAFNDADVQKQLSLNEEQRETFNQYDREWNTQLNNWRREFPSDRNGVGDVRVDHVPDPKIEHQRDAIVRITSSGICGSDLHLLNGYVPTMESGDILGHESMGEVVEVGKGVSNLKRGDRVVVPFTISCGSCLFCDKHLYSLCDTVAQKARTI